MANVFDYDPGTLDKWKPLFSITADLTSTPVGMVPGGFRVDIAYGAGSKVESFKPAPLEKANLSGTLLSGYDSVLVTSQAVVEFDGRVTIKFDSKEGDAKSPSILVGARLVGRADLARVKSGAPPPPNETVYNKWKSGFGDGTELPFILTVSLDVASAPIESLERTDPIYKPYLPLGRNLLLAYGKVVYGPGKYSPPAWVKLHVCEWEGQP
jgi:hypothetical protein